MIRTVEIFNAIQAAQHRDTSRSHHVIRLDDEAFFALYHDLYSTHKVARTQSLIQLRNLYVIYRSTYSSRLLPYPPSPLLPTGFLQTNEGLVIHQPKHVGSRNTNHASEIGSFLARQSYLSNVLSSSFFIPLPFSSVTTRLIDPPSKSLPLLCLYDLLISI